MILCQQNPVETIRKVAEFIGVDADDDFLQQIAAQTSFKKMREAKREGEAKEMDDYFVEGYSMYRKGTYFKSFFFTKVV